MRHEHMSSVDGHAGQFQISDLAREGLRLLRYAHVSARDADSQVADFALSIDELLETGMQKCDLRWLVRKGYVGHLIEITIPGQLKPKLRSTGVLKLFDNSCFILTNSGIEFVNKVLDQPALAVTQVAYGSQLNSPDATASLPKWDKQRRQLTLDGQIIRRWIGRISKQELLVTAFAEQGFADRIDDPLPPTPGIDSKDRLYTVVYRLNKSIHPPLIRFRCTSGRRGLYWEFVATKIPLNFADADVRHRTNASQRHTGRKGLSRETVAATIRRRTSNRST